jgi:hypothetical protein
VVNPAQIGDSTEPNAPFVLSIGNPFCVFCVGKGGIDYRVGPFERSFPLAALKLPSGEYRLFNDRISALVGEVSLAELSLRWPKPTLGVLLGSIRHFKTIPIERIENILAVSNRWFPK